MKLYLTESSWNGRNSNFKPVTIKHEYDLVCNHDFYVAVQKYSRRNNETKKWENVIDIDFSFKILNFTDDYIEIETNKPMCFNKVDDNGINLNNTKTNFKISLNDSIKLTTPTMDFGYIYIFSYK